MAFRVETIISGGLGGPYYNRLHYSSTGFEGAIGAEAAADAVRELWLDLSVLMHTTNSIQVQPEVVQVDDASGQPTAVFVTSQAVVTGGNAGDRIPAAAQLLAQHRTGVFVGGREIRGRTFIPGLTEDNNTNGRPSAGVRTAAALAFQTWFAEHDPEGGILGKNGFTEVSQTTIWDDWAVLTTRRS